MRLGLVCSFGLFIGCATAPTPAPAPALEPVDTPPLFAIALGTEAGALPMAQSPSVLVLRNARLIDGTGADPTEGVSILVEGGVIIKIGDVPDRTDATVIDLQGKTLLPGFIDAHVHLTFTPPANFAEGVVDDLRAHDADRALGGVANAWATLSAGFTTVRNVGGTFADRALRDAITDGTIPGPRMLVANHAITISGGHCDDTNTFHPSVMPEAQDYRAGVADGVDEVRKAVRYQIKHGADVIKVCATGGVMSQGDAVGSPQLDKAELEMAVEEAVRADKRVAAHAHGNLGIREAIEAGVHSVEHGSILDEPTIRMMKSRGTYLVPTLSAAEHVVRAADRGKLSDESAAKAREIAPKMRTSFAMAYSKGVKIALGSDAGVFSHGKNGHEFTLMVEEGMKPRDAIVAGTSAAADLLGLSNVGRIAEGAAADFVVVDGDPFADITTVESPLIVIKGGTIYVDRRDG